MHFVKTVHTKFHAKSGVCSSKNGWVIALGTKEDGHLLLLLSIFKRLYSPNLLLWKVRKFGQSLLGWISSFTMFLIELDTRYVTVAKYNLLFIVYIFRYIIGEGIVLYFFFWNGCFVSKRVLSAFWRFLKALIIKKSLTALFFKHSNSLSSSFKILWARSTSCYSFKYL